MELVSRAAVPSQVLPGRAVQKVVGKDSAITSGRMSMGFAYYSAEAGPMEPHQHAEETVYVNSARGGWVRTGPGPEELGERIDLLAGMTMHFAELEWHVFGYDEGGFLDVIFFYGQVDNIRPEEIKGGNRG
jgi:hypothetical protein